MSFHIFTWLVTLVILIFSSLLLLRHILVPFLVRLLTKIKISTVSFRSVKGIEWTAASTFKAGTVVRIGRVGWQRSQRSGALVTIIVENVKVELRKPKVVIVQKDGKEKVTTTRSTLWGMLSWLFPWLSNVGGPTSKQNAKAPRSRTRTTSSTSPTSPSNYLSLGKDYIRRSIRAHLIHIATLLINQSSWLLHLFDVQITRISVAIDDHVELRIQDIQSYLHVEFDQAPEILPLEKIANEGSTPVLCKTSVPLPASPGSKNDLDLYTSTPPIDENGLLRVPSYGFPGQGSPGPAYASTTSSTPTPTRTTTPTNTPTPTLAPAPGRGRGTGRFRVLRRSRAAKLFIRALGRAEGQATLVITIGPTSLHEVKATPASPPSTPTSASTPPSTPTSASSSENNKRASSFPPLPPLSLPFFGEGEPKLTHEITPACILLPEQTSVSATVRFGPKIGVLGPNSVQARVQISPVEVVYEKLRSALAERERTESVSAAAKKGDEESSDYSDDEDQARARATVESSARMRKTRIVKRLFEAIDLVDLTIPAMDITINCPRASDSTSQDLPSQIVRTSLRGFGFDIRSTDADDNAAIRDIFGKNSACRVRAIAFNAKYDDLNIRRISRDEPGKVLNTILTHDGIQLDGCSTWYPGHLQQDTTLCGSDPNLNIIQAVLNSGSVQLHFDLSIYNALMNLKGSRSPTSSNYRKSHRSLDFSPFPRLSFAFSQKAIHCRLQESASGGADAIEGRMDGIYLGLGSEYTMLCARRRDRFESKKALREELARREEQESGGEGEPENWQPREMSGWTRHPGVLEDDFDRVLHWTMGGSIGATEIFVNSETVTDPASQRLARLGAAQVAGHGSVRGKEDQTSHQSHLVLPSMLQDTVVDVEQGLVIMLWNPDALKAVQSMVTKIHDFHEAAPEREPSPQPKKEWPINFGLTGRLNLGSVVFMVTLPDPNPDCSLKLNRGLHLYAATTIDFANFSHGLQIKPDRHPLSASDRSKLRLINDGTAQALASSSRVQIEEGKICLAVFHIEKLVLAPVYNASDFKDHVVSEFGDLLTRKLMLIKRREPSLVGWDFQRGSALPKTEDKPENPGNPEPIDPDQNALLPLINIAKVSGSWSVQSGTPASGHSQSVSLRVSRVKSTVSISHAYCIILAFVRIRSLAAAFKRPSTRPPSSRPSLRLEIYLDNFQLRAVFPLGERLFVYTRHVYITSDIHQSRMTLESGMTYVPSPRVPEHWEELTRMKNLTVSFALEGEGKKLTLSGDAFRVRIPFRYQVSHLVLNITTTFKTLKLLLKDAHEGAYVKIKVPVSEEPKHVPLISVKIRYLSFEIKDDPIETKLNLIWRVGLNEQLDRLDREAAFAAKVAIIEAEHGSGSEKPPKGISERWGFSADHSVSVKEARNRLDQFNSQAWINRFRTALYEQHRREEAIVSKISGERLHDAELPISVLAPERFAPLFRAKIIGLSLDVRNPGLDRNGCLTHMEDLAGPFPPQTEFSLMVPLRIDADATTIDCSLRDYPLPLLRVPPVKSGPMDEADPDAKKAFRFRTTIVIAEELAGDDSYYLVPVQIMRQCLGDANARPLIFQIAKTIMPVKTYAQPEFIVSTPAPTDFTWGRSYDPAMQDLTKVFDTFTHPPRDPSPKPGFWDKFRLVLHWKVKMEFHGPVHLHLKGSRDPYQITDHGAGFVLAWMGKVWATIGHANPERKLIQIYSDQLILSIPDLSAYIDNAATGTTEEGHPDAGKDPRELPKLLDRRGNKTCAKFVNGVQVGFGFVFERTCREHDCPQDCKGELSDRKCRMFDFKPHHAVHLITEESLEAKSSELGYTLDSYEGFRSDFIHFSTTITTLGHSKGDATEECSSFHFTPKGFTHFFAWWGLFNHYMSLPIRQGKLFPLNRPSSKKFGRSLATIKYRFDIAPLFISHIYPQYSKDDWIQGRGTSLGLKARIERFQADAHQREQKKVVRNDALARVAVIKHKPFYAADIFLDDVKLRAVRSVFHEPERNICDMTPDDHTGERPSQRASDLTKEDREWYAYDDYVDTDSRPTDDNPHIEMHDIGDCPKFHYSKWKLAFGSPQDMLDLMNRGEWRDPDMEASKFGREPSHYCLLGEDSGIENFQQHLVNERIAELENEITTSETEAARAGYALKETLSIKIRQLQSKKRVLVDHKQWLTDILHRPMRDGPKDKRHEEEGMDRRKGMLDREGAGFENVYHVHCPRLFLNNTSRNIVLKYYYSSRLRKGFDYHMSNTSLNVLKQQVDSFPKLSKAAAKTKREGHQPVVSASFPAVDWISEKSGNALAQGLFKLLLGDHVPENGNQEEGGEPLPHNFDEEDYAAIDPSGGLPSAYHVRNSHFLLLMKPQLALRSEADNDSVVLLTVGLATFRGFTVMDPDYEGDDAVNAHVLHRNYALLRGLQSFYPSPSADIRDYASRFVPLEVMLDSKCESTDFDRIVSQTDGSLHYDKFNQLRLKNILSVPESQLSNVPAHIEHNQDLCVLSVPRFGVLANSKHYGAIYNVITDLMLYQDPDQRERSQRLDTYLYAFDRRDAYRFVLDVAELQTRIRELETLARGYEDSFDQLTREGKLALIRIRADLLDSTEALNTIFDAVKAAQSHNDPSSGLKASLRLEARAGELAWYMFGEDSLIAKLAMKGVSFSWVRKKDGSAENALVIDDLQALNTSPDAVFTEVLSKYHSGSASNKTSPFARASWSVLAPVGGITIIEHFGLELHPVRLQIEKRLGKQVMDYVFQGKDSKDVKGESAKKSSVDTVSIKEHSLEPEQMPNSGHVWQKAGAGDKPKKHGSILSLSSTSNEAQQNSHKSNGGTISPMKITRRKVSAGSVKNDNDTTREAEAREMRSRASLNRTFVSINISSTTFVLSYKGDKTKNITDVSDLKFTSPELLYKDRTWSFQNLVQQMKKDVIKAAWSQRGALVKGYFRRRAVGAHAPSTMGMSSMPSGALSSITASPNSSTSDLSSDVKLTVQAPSQSDDVMVPQVFDSANSLTGDLVFSTEPDQVSVLEEDVDENDSGESASRDGNDNIKSTRKRSKFLRKLVTMKHPDQHAHPMLDAFQKRPQQEINGYSLETIAQAENLARDREDARMEADPESSWSHPRVPSPADFDEAPAEPVFDEVTVARLVAHHAILVPAAIFGILIRLGLDGLANYDGRIIFPMAWAQGVGCVIMGTALARKTEITIFYPPLYTALATGLAGSITSFSTWMFEAFASFANLGHHTRGGLYDFMDGLAYSIATWAIALTCLHFGKYVSRQLPSALRTKTLRNQQSAKSSVDLAKSPPSSSLLPPLRRARAGNFTLDALCIVISLLFYVGALLLYFLGPVHWRSIVSFSLLLGPPGTILRFLLSKFNTKDPFIDRFPIGTFVANMLGTAVLSATYVGRRANGQTDMSITTCNALYAIDTGFCGCLSTVSTFAVESRSIRGNRWRWFYVFGSVILGQLIVLAIVGGVKWSSTGLGPTCASY